MRQIPKLLRRVCKKANATAACRPVFTRLCPIPRRMKPTLEHSVCEFAGIASFTAPFAKVRARHSRVVELSRIPAASLFSGMGVGAFRPVVRPSPRTSPYLELIDSKLIA
ncbi:hypothetical protein IEQ34_003400 [Dendrobium chrysotoxum]|uniref:Uncharacterized protein n=1 Tax=Dendrobium chrysotoxum TaxID=161865 RepID=A0AAV7HJ21_DENCH|nr:hypothetical protein IEQ34_003400 [Dendrobium chrysotoxum]